MSIYPSPLGAKSQIPEVYLYDYFELQPVVTTIVVMVSLSPCAVTRPVHVHVVHAVVHAVVQCQ